MNIPFSFTLSRVARRRRVSASLPRQQGMVLEIVLVVLVALMLASIALFRSVDTSSSVATNIAFKNDASNRAQLAFDQIFSWLSNQTAFQTYVSSGTDCASCNYSSQMLQTNAKGIPNIIAGDAAAFDAAYTNIPPASALMNADGMKVRYLIERMCTRTGPAQPQYCTMESAVKNDGTINPRAPVLATKPVLRVTVRVDGPRNTLSFIQASITP